RMFALMPDKLARRSENRRGPSISSRMISNDQRSPINSSARAVPQASLYQRLLSASISLVSICDFMVVFYNWSVHNVKKHTIVNKEDHHGLLHRFYRRCAYCQSPIICGTRSG